MLIKLALEFYLVVLLLLPALSMTEHILLHYLSFPATVKKNKKKKKKYIKVKTKISCPTNLPLMVHAIYWTFKFWLQDVE